jgi:hypothetical protein
MVHSVKEDELVSTVRQRPCDIMGITGDKHRILRTLEIDPCDLRERVHALDFGIYSCRYY